MFKKFMLLLRGSGDVLYVEPEKIQAILHDKDENSIFMRVDGENDLLAKGYDIEQVLQYVEGTYTLPYLEVPCS